MTDESLIIRADASPAIGSGHIMRCRALAEIAQERGIHPVFLSRDLSPATHELLRSNGFLTIPLKTSFAGSFADSQETAATANSLNSRWIVIDGYNFNADYIVSIRQQTSAKILFMDDYAHLASYPVDVLLNQNCSAHQFSYETPAGSKLLLGTKYALIRKEFQQYRDPAQEIHAEAANILITMGGSDPTGMCLKTLDAMKEMSRNNLSIKLICGALNSRSKEIRDASRGFDKNVTIYDNINDMGSLIRWADIVISAAGSTCWEICYIGTPLIVVVTAENQSLLADGLKERECAINLGWHHRTTCEEIASCLDALINDSATRKRLSMNQRALIDGKGAKRVLESMYSNNSDLV